MTQNNPESSDQQPDVNETSNDSDQVSKPNSPIHSATTSDVPAFGWSGYAERVNGRFAMIGFLSILLIEALSHGSFLHWAGILP